MQKKHNPTYCFDFLNSMKSNFYFINKIVQNNNSTHQCITFYDENYFCLI